MTIRRRLAAALLTAGLAVGAGAGPAAARPASATAGLPATAAATRHHETDWSVDIAKIFGLAAAGIGLIVLSEGFGILGGRIRPMGSVVADQDEEKRKPDA